MYDYQRASDDFFARVDSLRSEALAHLTIGDPASKHRAQMCSAHADDLLKHRVREIGNNALAQMMQWRPLGDRLARLP